MGKGLLEYMEQTHAAAPPEQSAAEPQPPRLIREDMIDQARARAAEITATYERREREARQTAEKIIQGIKDRRQPAELLLLAARCIDSLTGDTGLYSKVAHAMRGAYGAAMFDGELPEVRMEQLKTEIARLTKARNAADRGIFDRRRELERLERDSLFYDGSD